MPFLQSVRRNPDSIWNSIFPSSAVFIQPVTTSRPVALTDKRFGRKQVSPQTNAQTLATRSETSFDEKAWSLFDRGNISDSLRTSTFLLRYSITYCPVLPAEELSGEIIPPCNLEEVSCPNSVRRSQSLTCPHASMGERSQLFFFMSKRSI